MFTGIIQAVATIKSPEPRNFKVQLKQSADEIWPADPIQIGESITVDGCCLTVVQLVGSVLVFNLSEETLSRTRAQGYCEGMEVNLERAMKASDRFGGHVVQGHVDCVGRLHSIDELESSWTLEFSFDPKYAKYIIEKGSVTVDGISLTAVTVKDDRFTVAIIPHTWKSTNLSQLNPGERVNLEFDVLAKYVEKMTDPLLKG